VTARHESESQYDKHRPDTKLSEYQATIITGEHGFLHDIGGVATGKIMPRVILNHRHSPWSQLGHLDVFSPVASNFSFAAVGSMIHMIYYYKLDDRVFNHPFLKDASYKGLDKTGKLEVLKKEVFPLVQKYASMYEAIKNGDKIPQTKNTLWTAEPSLADSGDNVTREGGNTLTMDTSLFDSGDNVPEEGTTTWTMETFLADNKVKRTIEILSFFRLSMVPYVCTGNVFPDEWSGYRAVFAPMRWMQVCQTPIGHVKVAPGHRGAYVGQNMPYPSNKMQPSIKCRNKDGKSVDRFLPIELPDYFKPGTAPHLSTKPTSSSFIEIDVLDRRTVEV
jgi:hypothetical protein